MRKYIQLIPENVCKDLQVISELIKPTIKGFSEDNLKEIISIVACHVRKDEEEGPAPLSMAYINKLVPQGQKYLTQLVILGIVERSGQFIPGATCYKYYFSEAYNSKYNSFLLKNAKLILRIETVWDGMRKKVTRSIRGHLEQAKYLRQLTIEPEALQFIEKNFTADTHKFNCAEASVTRILNGDIFYTIDSTSERFHSNVTNLDKDLRPYLRINGQKLVNADTKNSQPYLSTIILTDPGKVSFLTNNPAFALLLQNLKISLNEDVKKYISLVVSGSLYEYLMDEFSKEGLHLTRSETKKQVLRILFARNRMPKNPINDTPEYISRLSKINKRRREDYILEYPTIKKARQVFIKRFPTVHRIFSKVRSHEKGDKFHNFRRFSILLQRIESYLMLHIVLKRIYRELPGVIAITVHDSVMTGILTDDVEAVRKIITEELTLFVGFPPKIEIEGVFVNNRKKEESNKIYNQYVITNSASIN